MLPFFWHIWKYHLLNSHAANWYVQIICALELPLSYRRLKSFEVPSSSTIPTRELSIKHQTDAFHSWWTISGCSAAPSVSRFLSRFIGASVSMGNPPSWVRQCPEELGTGEGGYLARICCLGGLAVCWWVLSCTYLKVRDCRSGLNLDGFEKRLIFGVPLSSTVIFNLLGITATLVVAVVFFQVWNENQVPGQIWPFLNFNFGCWAICISALWFSTLYWIHASRPFEQPLVLPKPLAKSALGHQWLKAHRCCKRNALPLLVGSAWSDGSLQWRALHRKTNRTGNG